MANRTISLKSQPLNFFGPTPASKWGVITWGLGSWGQKIASDTNSPPMINNIGVFWTKSNTYTMTDIKPVIKYNKVVGGSITFTFRMTDMEVKSGGFFEVFNDHVTNFKSSSARPTYTSQVVAARTYTTLTAAVTTWS